VNAVSPLTPAEIALGMQLPSRRDEEWKWTDLRRSLEWNYTSAVGNIAKTVPQSPFAKTAKARVTFVNGVFSREHSNVSGLDISEKPMTVTVTDPLIEMNSAMKPSGVTIRFSGNADQIVEFVYVSTNPGQQAIAVRNRIEIADGASASIVESHFGNGGDLTNAVCDIYIGKSARLDRVKYQAMQDNDTHLAHTIYNLSEASRLNDCTITVGATLSRENGTCIFNGENAEAKISGAYLLKGTQHVDTRLVIDHKVPNCVSRELFKCVMDDKSRGIFQGKVIVRQDAQKTDGKQSSHALLLSEMAEFDAKPELEIYADDVVCGHGTTCGDLNHDHLFYLKSRGIPEKTARAMLVEAFVAEAIETIENEAVRDTLLSIVHERMG
jgi:Fe-S cluster assembly protein SufD